MEGDVIWDSISQLDFYLEDGSTLTGAIYDDERYAGNGGDGYCSVYLSKDSTWTVTGDSGFTITVSSYSDSADFSGAATADSWENHQAEKPEAIA